MVALVGGLGTGKTVFAKALAKKLGVREALTSPSYVIISQYRVSQGGIKIFFHIDLYRLRKLASQDAALLNEALHEPRSVAVVEWADRARQVLHKIPPKKRITIQFLSTGPSQRTLWISGGSSRLLRRLRSSIVLRTKQFG